MRLSVSQTAQLCGVSVRTLHYYDEIGLVTPAEVSDSGYRYYDEAAISLLQQVLFYRELEVPLKQIVAIMHHPDYDREHALRSHRQLLLLKQQHMEELLRLLDDTLEGKIMSKPKTTLEDIKKAKAAYSQEAQARYGATPQWAEYQSRPHTDQAELEAANQADEIFAGFAATASLPPNHPAVQALVEQWQQHITSHYYACTKPILSSLADMYVGDPRFTENLDRFGPGTAQRMHDAIKIYCQ